MRIQYQIANIKFQITKNNHISLEIWHWKLDIRNYSSGFTLVELLAVITVFVVVGVVTTGIFLSSFRATDKSDGLTLLRQNGDYAITQIEKQLRFAQTFNGVSNDIISPPTSFSACTNPIGSATPTQYKHVQITNFDGGVSTFSCSTGNGGNLASNSASLLDTQVVTAVEQCYFTCVRSTPYSAPTVTLNITLAQRKTTRVESITSLNFQTSVTMRNSTQQTK